MTRFAVLLMMVATPLMASTLARSEPARGNNGSVWIDVRTAQEYQLDHLPGAVLIPHTRIARGVSEQYPNRNTPINLYGADGVRSRMAMEALQALGYQRVEDLGSLNAIRGIEPATVSVQHTANNQ
ncbi:rhodanese-like domain-containing protein [Oceanimonas sp. CAM02]|uniref:rhodanese-like domain-containing protein n=1 Tax=Oceanimonas sp. CAM02 TaxID=3080336 RepID=UPI002936984D|nr:rhodanese-like domain-containing protein [Oceanimonas sp. CAM02]MDV2857918.1 rhodanese-like domain-containing protein [Oceanimonas sp. CAM02]